MITVLILILCICDHHTDVSVKFNLSSLAFYTQIVQFEFKAAM